MRKIKLIREDYLDEVVLFGVLISLLVLLGFGMTLIPEGAQRFPINAWTIGHVLLGIILAVLRIRPALAVPFIVLWEPFEQLLLVPLAICSPAEMLVDSVIDIIAALIAYTLTEDVIKKKVPFKNMLMKRMKHLRWK